MLERPTVTKCVSIERQGNVSDPKKLQKLKESKSIDSVLQE